MISDKIVSNAYGLISRDLDSIWRAQMLIASRNQRFEYKRGHLRKTKNRQSYTIAERYPELYQHLASRPYKISKTDAGCYVTMSVLRKLRFLDMKKYGNFKIYNRQIWGILYNNAYKDIRNNISDAVYNEVSHALHKAFS